MWQQALVGIATGVGYALTGWAKNRKEENDKKYFDWMGLGKSAVICGIVGGIAGQVNQDFSLMLTGTVGIGVTKGIGLLYDLLLKES